MKEAFKKTFQDKTILWSFIISILLLIAIVIYIAVVYPQIPPVLPLYNRMAWGYSRLGEKFALLIPLGITVLFFIINTIAAALIYNKAVLISRMISTISFTLILCSSVYTLKIMQLIL